MTTWCEDCEHVHTDSRGRSPYLWLCIKFPKASGFGFVTRETWDNGEPYRRCKDINTGHCPLFERRRGPQMELGT